MHEIALSAGTVRYRDTGQGEPLVSVHGLLTNGELWRKVVPHLEGEFRCIAPDWPLGSHSPAMNRGADLTPPGLAARADEPRGLRQLPPEALSVPAARRADPGGIAGLMTPLRMRVLRRLPIAYGWLAKRPIGADASDAYLRPALTDRAVRRDLAKALRGMSPRYTLEGAEALRTFDRPTLIAWASEDRVFPVEHGRRLA